MLSWCRNESEEKEITMKFSFALVTEYSPKQLSTNGNLKYSEDKQVNEDH